MDVGIDMRDVWETCGPYIKLIQFGLLFHFAPIFIEFIVDLLCTIGMVLWDQGVNAAAPLAWLTGFLLTLWLGLFPVPAGDPGPCSNMPAADTRRTVDAILVASAAMDFIVNTPFPSVVGPLRAQFTSNGPPKRLEACPPHHGRASTLSPPAAGLGT
jgi:hypothetical protein